MCSIIGFSKRSVPMALAREGFGETKSRGPNMSRFVEAGNGWLGFHLLAIMGFHPEGMQPFELDGILPGSILWRQKASGHSGRLLFCRCPVLSFCFRLRPLSAVAAARA